MGKGKLEKFAEMATYKNVFQYPYSVVEHVPFEMQGHWHEQYFHNNHPIVLELGCGKGEYTVGLAKRYPDINFIGVDIKGARMWTGATQALNMAHLLRPPDEEPSQASHVDLFHGALSPLPRR